MLRNIGLLIFSGVSGVVLVSFIVYFSPKIILQWMEILDKFFLRIFESFKFFKDIFDRRAVASSIKNTVNSICEHINKEAPDALPHPLQIEWVKTQDQESFIRSGNVVVRLKRFANQDRNIVNTTLMYLKVGFLPRSRNYLDDRLANCCEFKIATKIFLSRRDTGAYDYFIKNELVPFIESDPSAADDLQLLEDIDSVGYFTHVFLSEVKQTGEKLLGTIKTEAVEQEIRNFAKFLQKIANKATDADVPLGFFGTRIKVAVILVARKEKITLYGIEPYIHVISRQIKDGYESIYIGGWGTDFIKYILDIKKGIGNQLVNVIRSYKYSVRGNIEGLLLVCQPNYTFLSLEKKFVREIYEAILEIVPEIKNEIILIKSIARIKDGGCKIVVAWSSVRKDHFKAVGICIGKNNEYLHKLKEYFPKEFISIIPWSENKKELIVNSLYPLKPINVINVELDEVNSLAKIFINTDEAIRIALGPHNNNKKLACEITGLTIQIIRANHNVLRLNPEDELRELLDEVIPEISYNKIEIVRLARIKYVGSRLIVKWKKQEPNYLLKASEVCRGKSNYYLKKIGQRLQGEWIYFHDYYDDPKEQIIECLYPLKREDILSIDLDEENGKHIAIITISESAETSPLFHNNNMFDLSENITAYKIRFL